MFMEDLIIDLGLSTMLRMMKDSKAAKRYQRAMLKLFGAIARAYKSQPEFREVAERELAQ